jgi:glycosyltransferase involved in cell wall biosynthesis
LRVLIDDGLSSLSNITGVGQHGYNVYKNLKNFCDCDITDYQYFKVIPRGFRKLIYEAYTNFHSFYKLYDLIHYQNHFIPKLKGKAKRVVTVHDLSVFRYPETVPSIYVKRNQNNLLFAVKNADAVITPSEFTKSEILSIFPWAKEEKVFSCESGLREIFLQNEVKSDILEKNKINSQNYFFFLGSISKRKNLEFLLNSFIKAKEKKSIAKETQLVLAGQDWWGASKIQDLISLKQEIITTGYLTDEDIVCLYRNSKAVIFPSIYEGFGTPIIEAMSQRIPLIISNIPTSQVLNSRHNNQMLVFDLGDEKSIINAMTIIDSDDEKIRTNLNYGDMSIYNFRTVAKKHFDVYNSLL